MAQKQKKAHKRTLRGFIIKLLLVAFLGYVAVSFVKIRVQFNEKKEQLLIVEEKIAEQEVINEGLKEVNEKLKAGADDEYKAKIVREHGYGDPNEKVYKNS